MAIMMGSLYEALLEGGTSHDAAKKAAEEVADYQKQLSDLKTDMVLVKTLLGVIVAGVASLVMKTFFV